MTEKGNITIYQKIFKSKIFFIFLIPISLALITSISQKLYYRYETQKDINKLNVELTNLKEEKNGLNGLLDYYKSESNIEKEAKVRLNLKKEGEKVVIILPQATSTSENKESISAASENIENIPNYKKWWYYFFGK